MVASRAAQPQGRTKGAYDAVVVGGGPAGLSAALVLGRCRRSVLVVDAGRPRNYAALRMHNYLSREGIAPSRFLETARREVARMGVEIRRGAVTGAQCHAGGKFVVRIGKERVVSETLLLATGVVDELPEISNVAPFYGRGVHHCPYCDGWPYRDRMIAAFGSPDAAVGLAMSLRTWSERLVVVTNGEARTARAARRARAMGVPVRTERIVRLESRAGKAVGTARDPLGRIVFQSGDAVRVAALFFNTDKTQRSALPRRLGCVMSEDGAVVHDRKQRTGVEGLFLAGDASMDVQFVVVAAAEGAKAGVAINRYLQDRAMREVRS